MILCVKGTERILILHILSQFQCTDALVLGLYSRFCEQNKSSYVL